MSDWVVKCPKCGAQTAVASKYCAACGALLESTQEPPSSAQSQPLSRAGVSKSPSRPLPSAPKAIPTSNLTSPQSPLASKLASANKQPSSIKDDAAESRVAISFQDQMTQAQKIILAVLAALAALVVCAFGIFFVAGMAITGNKTNGPGPMAVSSTVASSTTVVAVAPTLSPAQGVTPPLTRGVTQSPCEANKWALIPTKLYSLPDRDGFKHIVVTLAVQNNSRSWGILYASDAETFVSTEGGFKYPSERFLFIGDNYQSIIDSIGTASPRSDWTNSGLIPPGFTVRATLDRFFLFIYRVAENQNHFKITVSAHVSCVQSDGSESIGPLVLISTKTSSQ